MKVLHVIPSVGPVRGGPSQAVLGIVRALRAYGVDAEIATTDDNGPDLLDVALLKKTEFDGVPIWFFPRISPPLKVLREFIYSPMLTSWVRANCTSYDLIHVHALFSYVCTVTMRIARRKQIPYLVRPLGLLCNWALQQSALRKKIYLSLIERRNLDESAALEFSAEQELAEAAPLGLKAPGFVMPFGLDLPVSIPEARQQLRRRLHLPADEPLVLFLSRLHPKKGLDYLLDALETLSSRRFSLLIAGAGSVDYESEVRMRVEAGTLRERVHWVGFAQGEFKQLLLQGTDLFALTSHSESFAIAVLEALAAGTPVLATPGVPLAMLVRKFDVGWVTSLDRAAIAATAMQALDSVLDKEVSTLRSQRCRTVAANFEWSRIATRKKAVYEAILEHRSLPSFELAEVTL